MFTYSHRSSIFLTACHAVPPVLGLRLKPVSSILSIDRGFPLAAGNKTWGFPEEPSTAQDTGGRVEGKDPILWAFYNWDSTYTWQNLIRNKSMHTFRSQITGRNDPSRSGEGKSIVEKGVWGKGLGEVRNGPGRGRRREFGDSPVTLGDSQNLRG